MVQVEESPVFVVGLPRSGTTLMRMMLCCHPRLAVTPETNFLNSWARIYGHLDLAKDRDFALFWSSFSRSEVLPSFGLAAPAVRQRIDREPERDLRAVFRAVCLAYAERHGKPRWGEKTPRHAEHLDTLLDWFPAARVVFMLRDPRAVTSSILAKNWARSSTFAFVHARRWRRAAQALQRHASSGRVFVAPYERLVADPQGLLREICAFIGEEFDSEMIARTRAGDYRLYPDDPGSLQSQPVLKPLDPSSLDKWRSRLSRDAVAIVEKEAGPAMAAFGYRPETAGLDARQRALLCCHKAARPLEAFARLPWGKVLKGRLRTLVGRALPGS